MCDLDAVLSGQLRQRHARPRTDHFGHQAWANLKTDQPLTQMGLTQGVLSRLKFRFQHRHLFERLRLIFLTGLGQTLTQFQQALGQRALRKPGVIERDLFSVDLYQPLLQRLQCSAIHHQSRFGIPSQGMNLTLTLCELGPQAFQLFRCRRQTDAHAGTGGVEHIHCFVRQLASGQITRRQVGSRHHRIIAQVNPVAFFIHVRQAAQNGHGLADTRFVQLHRLKASGQRGVFFEVFFVFAPRGGRDGAQFATGQCRLEQVGGVRASGIAPRANQGMGFVDKHNDRHGGGFDLVDDALETAFEFSFHAGARLQQAHVQRQQLNALQHRRHFVGRDAQRQPFHDRGFAHTRFPHHNRVVLTAPRQDVDHLPDGVVTAQHRIELPGPGLRREVMGKALQQGFTAYHRRRRAA